MIGEITPAHQGAAALCEVDRGGYRRCLDDWKVATDRSQELEENVATKRKADRHQTILGQFGIKAIDQGDQIIAAAGRILLPAKRPGKACSSKVDSKYRIATR